MKSVNHKQLAQHLKSLFPKFTPRLSKRAFLFGCIEPDLNPFSYLRGSIRCRALKGHHFNSSQFFMERTANRLQCAEKWSFLNYFQLGTLIHYLSDAFTASHNEFFTGSLLEHRSYEFSLNDIFLNYLRQPSLQRQEAVRSAAEEIVRLHRQYRAAPRDVRTDASYIIEATECVMRTLLPTHALQSIY